jgi:CheY-like chemotaxis protein
VLGTATSSATRLLTRAILRQTLALARTRVLVAEDNVVANGFEAVDAWRRLPYDCIFMDCHMPELDGYAATAVIRQQEGATGRHTPIIAVTANAMQGDQERCLASGMDAYLRKPIQAAALEAVLQQWTSSRVHPPAAPMPRTSADAPPPVPTRQGPSLTAPPEAGVTLPDPGEDEEEAFVLSLCEALPGSDGLTPETTRDGPPHPGDGPGTQHSDAAIQP